MFITTKQGGKNMNAHQEKNKMKNTKRELSGELTIERNFESSMYRFRYNNGLALIANVTLPDGVDASQVKFSWGWVYPKGNKMGQMCEMRPLDEAQNMFWCRHDNALGRIYRCEARCPGFSGVLTGEYGPIIEEDFEIPITGEICIKPQISVKDDIPQIVLKAECTNLNINKNPNYTWLVGDKVVDTGNYSRLNISKDDVSKTILCKISDEMRIGFKQSESFVLSLEKYNELKVLLERKRFQIKIRKQAEEFYAKIDNPEDNYNTKTSKWIKNWFSHKNKRENHSLFELPNLKDGTYQGMTIHGLPNGYGVLKADNGCTYEGFWKDGTLNGYAIIASKDGIRYAGYFENGMFLEGGDKVIA